MPFLGDGGGTGWGGVEGRGENADNCNWIKINKLIKKNKIKNTSVWTKHYIHYFTNSERHVLFINKRLSLKKKSAFLLSKHLHLETFFHKNIIT